MAVKPAINVRLGNVRVSGAAPAQTSAVEAAVRGAVSTTLHGSSLTTARTSSLQRQIQQQIIKALAAGSGK
ncbi:MAG TPA: hypothetical protein VGO61_03620 [Steroidobacteraceae bacterium]|jgi:hypothetical protein|nr:hypothetical protein [Steroidobacteraceae bacterium]